MKRFSILTMLAVIMASAIGLAAIRCSGQPVLVMMVSVVLWMIGEQVVKGRWQMSVEHYKLVLPSSSQKIKEAKESLKKMSRSKKIDLMVKAGALTDKQAAVAKKKLDEVKASK